MRIQKYLRFNALSSMLVVGCLLASMQAQAAAVSQKTARTLATQGDAKQGIAACSSCHGDAGQGKPAAGFPKLAGLPAAYLLQQLRAFADGSRSNAVMVPMAKALSPGQAKALATYYARLPVPASPSTRASPALVHAGAELARHGRFNDDLPSCELCHGRGGVGVGSAFPPLAGQSSVYIAQQLHAWKQHTRPPGPMGLMQAVADKLSAADIKSAAAYFSTQSARPEKDTP